MLKKITKYFNSYYREVIFLFFLLGLNYFFRFYKLAQKGLWHTDEIDYYLVCHEAIRLFKNSLFYTSGLCPKLEGLYKTLQVLTQYPPKFAFYLVNSISWALIDKNFTILFVNAVASILTITVVFFIGRKFFNLRVGIIASILLSFSLIYLRYSRNGFSLALAYLFLTLSAYYYLSFLNNSRFWNLALSGFILGMGLLFHAQLFLFALVIIFAESISLFYFYNRNINEFLRRITVFIPAFFIPLALLETITNAGRVFRWYNASSYFRQICNTTAGNLVSQQGARIQPSYYLKVLWNLESPVISLLVILSLFFAIKQITSRRKNAQSIFLLTALFILPYLYWVLQRRLHQVEYNCLGSWPFMFLYIGLGVDAIFSNIKVGLFRITAITLFLLVSVSYSLHHLKTLFEIKSHFPEVSRILKEQNITKLIVYKNDGIYSYKDIDPYLIKVDMYTADSLNEVYEIARKEGAGFCFYGSWGYFLAKTKDAVVDGELAAKIKDTAMRPHYPLFLMGLMNSGIANTKAAEEYKDKIYDYMYLYKIKLPKPK